MKGRRRGQEVSPGIPKDTRVLEQDTRAREKEALRDSMRRSLRAMDPRTVDASARAMTERLLTRSWMVEARTVLVCLSFGDEISTWPLVDRLLEQGVRVLVPRAVRGTRRLHWHPYPCALRTLSFGLRQPLAGEPELPEAVLDAEVDVALLLGLAFDDRGYRLGYGGGFFDRFLAGRPFDAWGLAYDEQIIDQVPDASHDVALKGIITPTRTIEAQET